MWRFEKRSKMSLDTVDIDLLNGTAHFLPFSLIIEGATKKVLQFMLPQKSNYIKNFGSIEQNCIFEHYFDPPPK